MAATSEKIILHIGSQKTASTLLQQVLERDEESLRILGLDVISRKRMLKTNFEKVMNRYSVGDSISDKLIAGARNDLERLIAPEVGTHLLTNEDIFNRIRVGYFFDHLEYGLEVMQKLLRTVPCIILYVRSQPSLLESLFLQMVHTGQDIDFEAYATAIEHKLSWLRVAEKIADIVGYENLTVIPYESLKLSSATQYYQRFLQSCGVPSVTDFLVSDAEIRSRWANRSFSAVAVEMARRCYPLLEQPDRGKFRNFLQENLSTATHPKAELLSEAQTREILSLYAEENIRLFERFMPNDEACLKFYLSHPG